MIYLVLTPAEKNMLRQDEIAYYASYFTELNHVYKVVSKNPGSKVYKMDAKEIAVDATFKEIPV